jgi:tetratricopeptide (TPR) repeat protein
MKLDRLISVGLLLLAVPVLSFGDAPSVVLAQTEAEREAEAERLLERCREDLGGEAWAAALGSCQEAAKVYEGLGDVDGQARAMTNVGIAYNKLERYGEAVAVLQGALSLASSFPTKHVETIALQHLTTAYEALGQVQAAEEARQSVGLFLQAEELFQQGTQQLRSRQFREALQVGEQALEIYREIGDRQGEAYSLNNLGLAYDGLEQYQRAIDFYEQSLAIDREIGDRQGEVYALNNLGNTYKNLNQYQQAINYHEQSLAIAREIGDLQEEIKVLNNLGETYENLVQYRQAIDYYEQFLVIMQDIGDRQEESRVFNNLGNAYNNLSQYQEAINFYEQSLTIDRETGDRQGEVISLNNLGSTYKDLGQYQEAINYHEQSLAMTREIDDRRGEAAVLGNLGIVYHKLGQYREAINYHEQSLAINREIGDRQGEANSLGNLGNTYQSLGQYQEAINYHEQSFAIDRELGDFQSKTAFLINLGNAYQSLGQYQKAIDYYKQSLARARQIGNRQSEANSLNNLGSAYDSLGQYQEAINYHEQSLAIARQIGNRQSEANSLNNLGSAYDSLGQYQEAINYHEQSLAIDREIGDRQGESSSLNNLGNTHNNLGQYQEAIDYYERSLAIDQEIGSRYGEAVALGNLGNAYDSLGQYQEAINYHEQSLAIDREIGNRQGESSSLNNLGNTYRNLDQHQESINYHEQSLTIARKIGNLQGEAASLGNLGLAYYNLGQYQEAINYHEQSLAIDQEIGDRRGEGSSLGNLGLAYYNLGQYQEAINYHEQSLTIAREIGDLQGEANSLGNLGLAYYDLSLYRKAINFHNQYLAIAQEIGDRRGEANSLGNLGNAYNSLGQYQKASNYHEQSLAIDREIGNRNGEASDLNNLANTHENLGDPELAIVFYKQSVNVRESIRGDLRSLEPTLQQSYADTVAFTYRNLANLLLQQGRILEAQQTLELLKIEELQQFTRASYQSGKLHYDPAEQPVVDAHDSLINLSAKIYHCTHDREPPPHCNQNLYDQQIQLENHYNTIVQTFETTIRQNRHNDDQFYDPNALSSDALALVNTQPGTVLIYPVVLEDKLWLLWTATGGVAGTIEVPVTLGELSCTVQEFRTFLQQQIPSSVCDGDRPPSLRAAAQQLYDWLIRPIDAELAQNQIQHLIFAQDRVTRYIPMAALHDGDQYLIQRYTIATVLSAALTDTQQTLNALPDRTTLGMGLNRAVPGFRALPAVAQELDAIVRTDDPSDSQGVYPGQVFLNDQFTWESLKNNVRQSRILHLATHAEFVPGTKQDSYLVLGTGEKLSIANLESLRTQLQKLHLVVLSACQTALGGEAQDGTEIAGVSSYFLGQNKAETVLASLWSVDDGGTGLLMERFYELLATGEMTKAEALRQAQLSFLQGAEAGQEENPRSSFERVMVDGGVIEPNTPAHPYYWAPFILIGNSL